MSDAVVTDLWAEVPGQADAVRRLRAAVESPTHAYLISGPEGSGKRAIARAFAADLLTRHLSGADAERVRRQVAVEGYPAMVVVEREGPFISAKDARAVVERASRSPLEGPLQVIVMVDFHLVRDAGPMLLKSLEEPPPTTLFVLLAEDLPIELETIASRCVNITLDAVPTSVLADRLRSEGVDEDLAEVAAAGAGGSLTRARLLARDPLVMERRNLWYTVPERLDGRGNAACSAVDQILESIAEMKAPLEAMQKEELAEFSARAEAAGIEVRKGDLTRMTERHKREARRMHVDELRLGLGVLVSRYRDDMTAEVRPDHDRSVGTTESFLKVADSVQELCDNLAFNVGDSLALQALFVSLPPLADRSGES